MVQCLRNQKRGRSSPKLIKHTVCPLSDRKYARLGSKSCSRKIRTRGDAVSDSVLARRALVQESAIIGLVLETYKANMARSRNEREAFATAVRIYQAHNSHSPETEARRAVADIICDRQNGRREEQQLL